MLAKTRINEKRPQLVTIGHVGYDIPTTIHGKRTIPGGAAYYATRGARIFSNRVAIVTRVGKDFDLNILKRLGINLSGVKVINTKKTFRWYSHYDKNFNVIRSRGELNVGATISPKDIPADFLNAKHIHIASMPWQMQRKIIDYLKQKNCKAKISIDTVEKFIIDSPKEVRDTLAKADIVFLNEREYERLTRLDKLERQMVIKKKGEKGAELLYNGKRTIVKAPQIKVVIDTSGAGDVLAGAFLTLLARGKNPQNALKEAVKVASKSVKAFGVEHI